MIPNTKSQNSFDNDSDSLKLVQVGSMALSVDRVSSTREKP